MAVTVSSRFAAAGDALRQGQLGQPEPVIGTDCLVPPARP